MNTNTQNQPSSASKLLRAFVTGYSPHKFTLEELHSELTSRFPYISDVVMPQQNNSFWKGYAFVDFETRTDFLAFIREKRVRIQRFEMNLVIKAHKEGKVLQKFIKDVNKRKVCVTGIPNYWDDLKLEDFFLQYGKVENAYVERRIGHEQNHLSGLVIFCAKRCAVECSLKRKIEADAGVQLSVSLYLQKDQSPRDRDVGNHQQKNEGKINNKIGSPRILPRGNSQIKKDLGNNQHQGSGDLPSGKESIGLESQADSHGLKPTSKNYFRVNYLDFKAHVCQFDNIRFNVKGRKSSYWW